MGSYELYRKYVSGSLILERTTVHISDDTGRIAMLEERTVGSDSAPASLQRYIYSNHLSTASLELDDTAAIISYEEYHPYGTTSYQAMNASINAVAKRYRYTGKERDEETGLYYHGARYYIPWLARWTAVDPMESKYAGMTPYNYSLCNPINFNDSNGMDPVIQSSPPYTSLNGETVRFHDPYGDVKIAETDGFGELTKGDRVPLKKGMMTSFTITSGERSGHYTAEYRKENGQWIFNGYHSQHGNYYDFNQKDDGEGNAMQEVTFTGEAKKDSGAATGFAVSHTPALHDDVMRDSYHKDLEKNAKESLEKIDDIKKRGGSVSEAESVARDAYEYRDKTRTDFQDKLTKAGKRMSQEVERGREHKTFEKLESQKGGKGKFETYEGIVKSSAKSNPTVNIVSRVSKIVGIVGIVVGVYFSVKNIMSAKRENRGKAVARELSIWAYGLLTALIVGNLFATVVTGGAWAVLLASTAGSILGGVGGGWLGGKVADGFGW